MYSYLINLYSYKASVPLVSTSVPFVKKEKTMVHRRLALSSDVCRYLLDG
jgi:hypothetical protein